MRTVKIRTVAVEFPLNVTKVTVDIVEVNGIITRTVENLTLDIQGIYQYMNTELFNIVLTELNNAGYDVLTTQTADQPAP